MNPFIRFSCAAAFCVAAHLLASPPLGAALPAAARAIVVDAAWIRATPPRAPVAGGFLVLRNTGREGDRLLSASSPDAERVEIHEMRMDGDMMRMRRLDDGLVIAPNATVELAPGGYHLMFIRPTHRFVAGETVTATLRFERAGLRTVRFEVRAMGSGAPPGR